MESHDSVQVLKYFAKYINNLIPMFRTLINSETYTSKLPDLGPPHFDVQIMSPDGMTDWTRMVWMIRNTVDYRGALTADCLSQIEAHLEKTVLPMHVSSGRKMWQREKDAVGAATTATTDKYATVTSDLLGDVARRLENIDRERVSLRV
jgi:hypothetical protein